MLQESPKEKNISKSRSGHPKIGPSKITRPSTKRMAKNEPSKPLPAPRSGKGMTKYY
jgi:hypothetical protein